VGTKDYKDKVSLFSLMSQLTNYIQKELEKGYAKKLITKKLLKSGYNKQEIAASFKSLDTSEPIVKRKVLDHTHFDVHVQWSKWVFPLLAIGVGLFLGYLVFLYATGDVTTNVEVTDCDDIVDSHEKDLCLLDLGKEDPEACVLIQEVVLQTACSKAVWEEDPCLYEFFKGGDREQCLWDLAVETGDNSYCMKKVVDRTECFVMLVEATGDVSLCENELFCYPEYALIIEDPSICDNAPDEGFTDSCYRYYNQSITP
jgi:hypothetical protein